MHARSINNILRPRLITFDVTGTLLKTKLEKHYLQVSSQYGLSVANPQLLVPSFKQHFTNLCGKHPVFGKHTGISWENWWKHLVFNVFKDQDPKISDEILTKIATTLISDYATDKCWYQLPGTVDILQYLNDQRIIVGVISNFDERLESILISTGIRSHFSFVLTSYDHGNEKPHPSIFKMALKLARDKCNSEIAPHEALHVGDNLKLDYNGAKNCGWNAIIMKHDNNKSNDRYKDISNDEIFQSLEELKNYFQIILN